MAYKSEDQLRSRDWLLLTRLSGWARAHQQWRIVQWRNVPFFYEVRICLHHTDGRQRVWHRPGEEHHEQGVQQKIPFGWWQHDGVGEVSASGAKHHLFDSVKTWMQTGTSLKCLIPCSCPMLSKWGSSSSSSRIMLKLSQTILLRMALQWWTRFVHWTLLGSVEESSV